MNIVYIEPEGIMEFELRHNVDGAVCSVGRCVLDEINVFTVSSLVYVYSIGY